MDPVKSAIQRQFCRGTLNIWCRLVCTANTEGMEIDGFLQTHLTKTQQFWRHPKELSNAPIQSAERR